MVRRTIEEEESSDVEEAEFHDVNTPDSLDPHNPLWDEANEAREAKERYPPD